MKKRISCVLFALVIFIVSAVPGFASGTSKYIHDNMNALDEDSIQSLNTTAKQLFINYGIDVRLFLTNDTDGLDADKYAEKSYNDSDPAENGLSIAVTDDDCGFYTAGEASEIFTDKFKDNVQGIFIDHKDYAEKADVCFNEVLWALTNYYSDRPQYPRLVDNANLLTDEEQDSILQKLNEISERQKFDVVIVTTNTLNGKTAQDYADDFYDYNGYGQGETFDGALLLVSIEDRDWHVSTTGYGIKAITDAGLNYMSKKFKPSLSDGNYAKAFNTFADLCDDFVTQAKNGKPYDKGNLPGSLEKQIVAAVIIGIIIGFIGVSIMKAKLKSVRFQAAANSYVRQNSFNVANSNDVFLYSTVSKVAKPKDTGSSGGSSTHTSSSGTTHGGGGGKF